MEHKKSKNWVNVWGEKTGNVIIVVGAQYGSESKGLVVGHLAIERNANIAIRTGSVNAGHTVYYKGKAYKNQQIPVAWVNPSTKLVIGAGAYVCPEILDREIHEIEKATGQSIKDRLFIDFRAGAHLPKHKTMSVGRHERMGTVGEGVSAAIAERIRREKDCVLFVDTDYARENRGKKFNIIDTVRVLNAAYDEGQTILVEGTQGSLLDVYLGFFPFTTSRQTIASSWLAEIGLSPRLRTEIVLVCRAFPIRVAGNSGPMPREISWQELARRVNTTREMYGLPPLVPPEDIYSFIETEKEMSKKMGMPDVDFHLWPSYLREEHSAALVNIHREVFNALPPETVERLRRFFEFTTVTKKLRRIAELDLEELIYTTQINRPTYLVMNFLNYLFPTLYEKGATIENSLERGKIDAFLAMVEDATETPIEYINYLPYEIQKRKR